MGQERDDHEIVQRMFVERVGHADACPLALDVDDRLVALQLLQPEGAWPRDGGDVVMADASQLEGERAADVPDAQHSNPKG